MSLLDELAPQLDTSCYGSRGSWTPRVGWIKIPLPRLSNPAITRPSHCCIAYSRSRTGQPFIPSARPLGLTSFHRIIALDVQAGSYFSEEGFEKKVIHTVLLHTVCKRSNVARKTTGTSISFSAVWAFLTWPFFFFGFLKMKKMGSRWISSIVSVMVRGRCRFYSTHPSVNFVVEPSRGANHKTPKVDVLLLNCISRVTVAAAHPVFSPIYLHITIFFYLMRCYDRLLALEGCCYDVLMKVKIIIRHLRYVRHSSSGTWLL